MSAFEDFVNAEIPKRISTEQDPLTPPTGEVFVTTGVGLTTECKSYYDPGTLNQGDIWYDNGTAWTRLTPGTSGKVLTTKGAAANPAWETAAGGGSSTNLIINGTMDIWQRGTAFNQVTHEQYTADRFMFRRHLPGGGFVDIDKETTIIPDCFSTSMKLSVDTQRGIPAASEYAYLSQRIEGYNYRNIIGKQNILSFWARSSVTGTYCVAFRNSDATRSYVSEYTISTANTWEHKTITLTFNATGTWQKTHLVGLEVCFVLMAGSTHQGTADTWNSANQLATSNQIGTWLASTANTFYISGVQLASSSDFAFRTLDAEIDACQRYYEKSYDIDVDPGFADWNGAVIEEHNTYTWMTFNNKISKNFMTTKRTNPTMVPYSPTGSSAANSYIRADVQGSGVMDISGSMHEIGRKGFDTKIVSNVAINKLYFHWTAEAEL